MDPFGGPGEPAWGAGADALDSLRALRARIETLDGEVATILAERERLVEALFRRVETSSADGAA